jgi:hypothetical protein
LAAPTGENVVRADPGTVGLADAIEASFAVTSISSTTLLEGIALMRPAVVVSASREVPYSPAIEERGAGREVSTAAEALAELVRMSDEGYRASFAPGMEAFRAEFFHRVDGGAAGRVAALIGELSGLGTPSYRSS